MPVTWTKTHERILIGFWAVCLILIQWPLLTQDPLLYMDDPQMIEPLLKVHSLADYIEQVQTEVIKDIQPIRDLSVWLNLQIPGHYFHLTNLFLWWLSFWLLYRLLRALKVEKRWALPLVLLFGLHPCLLSAAYWVAARKHVLAFTFILSATLTWLRAIETRKKRYFFLTAIFYLLSVFSNPIGILWPLWALLATQPWKEPSKKKKLLFVSVILLGLGAAVAVLNYHHYTTTYLHQFGISKFQSNGEYPDLPFLALGRYFWQLIFPWNLGVQYFPWALPSLAGVACLLLFAFTCWKELPKQEAVLWLLWFFLPLLVVTAKMTNVFVSNPYLLIPSIGFLVLLARLLSKKFKTTKPGPLLRTSFFACCLFFAWRSYGWARAHVSDVKVWEYSYYHSETPQTVATLGTHLFLVGRYQDAVTLGIRYKDWGGDPAPVESLIAQSIFRLPNVSPLKKKEFLKEQGVPGAETDEVMAALNLQLSPP